MRYVFHGSTEIISHPLVNMGRKGLDFGSGFYVTDILSQAQKWADRMARQRLKDPVIVQYQFDDEWALANSRWLRFDRYDVNWLNFIVQCRQGYEPAHEWDIIEGGIANDRVIDTVEGFINGTIDAEHALSELSKHQPNNQICFLNQTILEKCLTFQHLEDYAK